MRSGSPRPQFGQVWDYDGTKMMLLSQNGCHAGEWTVICLAIGSRSMHPSTMTDPYVMYGLADDPAKRVEGYTFIEGDTE